MKQLKARLAAFARSSQLKAIGAASVAGASTMSARADAIDVSSVVTAITGGVTTVSSIGIAVLSLVVTVKLFAWVRGALR